MFNAALIAGCVCVFAWLYLVAAHGHCWMVWRLRAPSTLPIPRDFATPRIAAVIPARNEADVIGRSVRSLLRQATLSAKDGSQTIDLHIFVVDDNSSDATANAAREAAASQVQRVTIITGSPLPPNWSGKLWAMQQGLDQALKLNPDFLLFTDSDIEHASQNVAQLVAIADGGYDMVSFMVKLYCRSVAEKLLIPAFVFFFFLL